MEPKPKVLIIDVDGVMTDGSFLYSETGKFAKRFSADDHDGLSLLKRFMEIVFVTGDRRGFRISHKRIAEDMLMPLELVSTTDRLAWIQSRWNPGDVVYIGDGIFDGLVFKGVGYSISVANALGPTRKMANFVTTRSGGDRAVAEAALHLLERFFEPFDPSRSLPEGIAFSGQWTASRQPGADLDPLKVARSYLEDFAARRLDKLEAAFDNEISLVDWETSAHGKTAVLNVAKSLFDSVNTLTIDICTLNHIGNGEVVAELIITVNGSIKTAVVDIITVNANGMIAAVRAFRGPELQ